MKLLEVFAAFSIPADVWLICPQLWSEDKRDFGAKPTSVYEGITVYSVHFQNMYLIRHQFLCQIFDVFHPCYMNKPHIIGHTATDLRVCHLSPASTVAKQNVVEYIMYNENVFESQMIYCAILAILFYRITSYPSLCSELYALPVVVTFENVDYFEIIVNIHPHSCKSASYKKYSLSPLALVHHTLFTHTPTPLSNHTSRLLRNYELIADSRRFGKT